MANELASFDKGFSDQIELQKSALIQKAKDVEIVDEETLNHANDLLQSAKNVKKAIEKKERSLLDPLNDTRAQIIAGFKPAKNEMDAIIKILSDEKIIPYQMALKKQIEDFKREEEARLKKEHEAAAMEGKEVEAIQIENQLNAVAEIQTSNKIKSDYSSSSIQMLWDFEIYDASVVPQEFLMPDEKKIKEAIKGGARDIKGIKIFQKPSLRSVNSFK